jgi:hypothetical protein
MRTPLLIALALPLSLMAGCKSDKAAEATPPPPLGQVLPNLPFPPDARPLTTVSGTDATEITLLSPHAPDSVAAYYRRLLADPPFRLVNETSTGGVVSFFANQDGPPLWVTVQSDGKAGSKVTIAGAVQAKPKTAGADTTAKKPPTN